MTRVTLAGLSLLLVLTGCATPVRIGTAPSVRVILGDPSDVAAYCTSVVGHHARGCILMGPTPPVIICATNDAECVAHEIEHLLGRSHDAEGRWRP